ncbi:MAG: hypothetical protein LQ344_004813 [Seirophora lacunosa]|nr:MAG: hypothetical protein LQ344_004813 [Seirophora lacunosa]
MDVDPAAPKASLSGVGIRCNEICKQNLPGSLMQKFLNKTYPTSPSASVPSASWIDTNRVPETRVVLGGANATIPSSDTRLAAAQ